MLSIKPKLPPIEELFPGILSDMRAEAQRSKDAKVQEAVLVRRDEEREFIEIDFDSLEADKIYLVKYQNEQYAVKRISDHEFAFYDVFE